MLFPMHDVPLRVGAPLAELETPAALVDLDRLERNIARMASYAREHGLALRPHVKTHKATVVAAAQLAAGRPRRQPS